MSFMPNRKDKITIDLVSGVVTLGTDSSNLELPLASPEAFSAISRAWLRSGWDNKYVFSYTGEGQDGDMDFVRGNLALRDHVAGGPDLDRHFDD